MTPRDMLELLGPRATVADVRAWHALRCEARALQLALWARMARPVASEVRA